LPVQARYGGPADGDADAPRRGFDAFLDAVRRYERFRRGKHVTLEYVAIRNVTMGDDDVAALARELTGFNFLLNVIPFNPILPAVPAGGAPVGAAASFEAPTMAEVRAFTARLRPLGFPVKIRLSGGQQGLAGCGQLGRTLLSRRGRPARAAAPS
jgi:23S rRNA (adenine2503-C2)-methyltransferase